ncbi:cytochrome c oxidase subunit 2 [Albidovulum inexpectatum]|uniref:Cytochrome c oxidase subunit 2 n=1 Tax=Albidovulum inexpectatum TaxID=196587 RepID=A0A2S5JIJ7_9RHOB|nr:cytochrome c oxidase subunit II [Albidovulum inexpectatum]PPB81085.1 cytochrome c oxidase subunit 2 [Albidovulum inexpectatum]
MRFATKLSGLGAAFSAMMAAGTLMAQDGITGLEVVGAPHPKGTGFQPAATELARDQQWLDHMLLYLCIGVVALVLTLLLVVILRYNQRVNPKPSRFTHNTPLEVTWTLIPIIILVVLGSFSLPVLFKQQEIPEADVVIKAIGNQWYWSYEYPDEGISFDSFMLAKEDLADYGYSESDYLLATDTAVVVPVGKKVVVQVTANDVIHSWKIPAFAVMQDAVPGRIAEAWFQADREGIYFGQCSELCGKDHAYMPITVKVVSEEVYQDWLQRTKLAQMGTSAPVQVAQAE